MRIVTRIVVVLVAVLVLFAVYVQMRPNTYVVERSATIAAPPAVVYAEVSDFHRWKNWSPWEKLDPAMKTDFQGPESGVGATYHWVGNKQVGEGSMKITEADPDSKVVIDLEFIQPFKSSSTTTLSLTPEGDGTRVSWSMAGNHNFVSKLMCTFMSMDKMIGPDFEKGLAQLGTAATAAAAADTTGAMPANP